MYIMGSSSSDESVSDVIEEKLYVCLGKDVSEGKSVLVWALQNSGGKRICILHVHQPAHMIPMMGGKFPTRKMKDQEVKAYGELERQSMHAILNEYLVLCNRAGIPAEKLHIEDDCIEKGIVDTILQHGIRKLIMGAGVKKHYSREMIDVKSKKALYVRSEAPVTCCIWFVCKGHLIYTRRGNLDAATKDVRSSGPEKNPSQLPETEQSNPLLAPSITASQINQQTPFSPDQDYRRSSSSYINSDLNRRRFADSYIPDFARGSQSGWDSEGSFDEWEGISRGNLSQGSRYSTCSSSDALISLALNHYVRAKTSEDLIELSSLPQPKEDVHQTSPPSVLEGRVEDELYDQLEQALVEAATSRQQAFGESMRRDKAEKDAREAIRRAKLAESIYTEELNQRKAVELELLREKQELEKIENQRNEIMQELRGALDHKSLLESQSVYLDELVKELEEKMFSAVKLLQSYKRDRDELQIERDNALNLAEELRQKQAENSSFNLSQFFSEFSFSEIEEATRSFDPLLKIGEGGYGSIYKGLLRHTEVAIKMLQSHSLQGSSKYQQEVDVLSKLRHPNLVTLIGACPEMSTLIYEYLPNGSLEDRLNCKDNSSPLSWQTRIRIAAELCSVLVFLHSSKPHSIVHGDLKPSNILLDANYVCKISDFSICQTILHGDNSTACCKTDQKGTLLYIDPEVLATGQLNTMSDVYSFGIILLRLLTGKPALGITKEVQNAVDNKNLKSLLDCSAGDWPYVQAQQLAHLALRCVEMSSEKRPDLGSEVWRVLAPMRASCGGLSSSSVQLDSEDFCQAPSYFICPIFQEVMQDPHVAADGFTYEAEALKGWLESGHDTSPMTNLKLTHTNLVPNLALRSAIQEWLQHRP